MTFSQIPYHRADLAAWKQQMEDITARFKAARTFEEADAAYREAATFDEDYQTMLSLARIRNNIDTRDEFYDAEVKFYNRELPKVQALKQQWTNTLMVSPFRAARITFSPSPREVPPYFCTKRIWHPSAVS